MIFPLLILILSSIWLASGGGNKIIVTEPDFDTYDLYPDIIDRNYSNSDERYNFDDVVNEYFELYYISKVDFGYLMFGKIDSSYVTIRIDNSGKLLDIDDVDESLKEISAYFWLLSMEQFDNGYYLFGYDTENEKYFVLEYNVNGGLEDVYFISDIIDYCELIYDSVKIKEFDARYDAYEEIFKDSVWNKITNIRNCIKNDTSFNKYARLSYELKDEYLRYVGKKRKKISMNIDCYDKWCI